MPRSRSPGARKSKRTSPAARTVKRGNRSSIGTVGKRTRAAGARVKSPMRLRSGRRLGAASPRRRAAASPRIRVRRSMQGGDWKDALYGAAKYTYDMMPSASDSVKLGARALSSAVGAVDYGIGSIEEIAGNVSTVSGFDKYKWLVPVLGATAMGAFTIKSLWDDAKVPEPIKNLIILDKNRYYLFTHLTRLANQKESKEVTSDEVRNVFRKYGVDFPNGFDLLWNNMPHPKLMRLFVNNGLMKLSELNHLIDTNRRLALSTMNVDEVD